MAMHFHLNLLHGNGLWSMRRDGSQNSDPTLAWIEEGFIFCDDDSDLNLIIFYGGHRVTHDKVVGRPGEKLSQCGDSDSDNSLLNLYDEKEAPRHMIRMTSHICLVCELEVRTTMQLHEHMHHFHVGSDPYHCECGGAFLTVCDLQIHKCNVHLEC